MRVFATNLRARTAELGLSQNEVARRAGLTERRMGNYFADAREPDLSTLVKLASVLGVTPNDLLLEKPEQGSEQEQLRQRLMTMANAASESELSIIVKQADVLLLARR